MPHYKKMPLPPDQLMLFSQSVEDSLPADSDARSFSDVMDCLDYTKIESKCSSLGCPPYPPRSMVKILSYAYSIGLRSSRKIEEMLKYDVRFIWIAGGLKPDHNTLARFRKENWHELEYLFKDSIRLCSKAGLVHLRVSATDGSKILSAASRRRITNQRKIDRELELVENILKEAEEIDAAEDAQNLPSSGTIPEHLRDAKVRKAKLKELAQKLKESGRDKIIESDTDCRIMRSTSGKLPCYNLQASADAQTQVILAAKVTNYEVDTGLLPEMIEEIENNTGRKPDVNLADSGYCDEYTFEWIAKTKTDVLMPLREQYRETRRKNELFSSECFLADEERDVLICPAGRELRFMVETFCGGATYRQYGANDCQSCSFHRQCAKVKYGSRRVKVRLTAPVRKAISEKLKTEEGKALFSLRAQSIEPVFGQIKSNRNLFRFLCWGIEGASAEIALATIAHNIRKCAAKAAFELIFCLKGRHLSRCRKSHNRLLGFA